MLWTGSSRESESSCATSLATGHCYGLKRSCDLSLQILLLILLIWKPVRLLALQYHLVHGCARVAHCATARWRNFSHYCCNLRLSYVFWAQRSTGLYADSTRCTQTRVHSARGKYIVRHSTSREASLRHSSGWGNWSVSPQYRDLRTRDLVEYSKTINPS